MLYFNKAKADKSAARSRRFMLLFIALYFFNKQSGLVYLKNQRHGMEKNLCLALR